MDNGNGYGVIIAPLTEYARRTRRIAIGLNKRATSRISLVRSLAQQSGPIAKETGFASALSRFAAALEHQVLAVAKDAEALADSVGEAADRYREQDEARAKAFLDMVTGGAR